MDTVGAVWRKRLPARSGSVPFFRYPVARCMLATAISSNLTSSGGIMATYKFQVNGRATSVESWDPAQPLLYVLRNQLGLHGPKFGCGLGQCGTCTVLLDGKPV